jgi:pimeloyl-ACP methyl ester carboxylesterase
MRAQFPDLRRVEMIAGAGHMIQLEASDQVNRIMLEFLSDIAKEK